ncbi:DUF3300 domain-containing protein [Colwellia sp. PAMC 21821]|uniref:DUF3300 domain-containing protein n=1 Tax=Colwellia sp. PAMC 21821 TaxID=1816219 RepID=UPI0009C04205|nr:DUF3300 domain-containing protein [Colwellia sp. PAMC 21821]ARD45653.1 hypothetical protein A3Q33_15990 [Colwellia sp. PAMC 21821]
MLNVNFKRSLSHLLFSLSSALVLSTPGFSAENSSKTYYGPNSDSTLSEQTITSDFTHAELEQMLAPIALYPDTLLTHILIATTYPIEVVDAERWLSKNSQLSAQALADAADDKDWDASVKALLPFPNVLKKLSDDLHWMRNLGDAFLQDEAQVLASVQILRQQADQAGNLKNMNNVNVVRETKTIIIESRQPDIIYVPYYDTRVVYGDWRWSHYPPIFWQQPVHYASHHGPYYWHNPVHLTVGLFFGAVHWSNRHVVVQHHKSRYYKKHSKKKVSTSYQSTRWQHNPRHRKGVAYRTSSTQKKYRSHTPSAEQHKALRANQKHFVNKNKHKAKHASNKYNSKKSQNLKHKLQVNRAVKIDKHKVDKHSLTKQEPYKNKNWRQAKDSKKIDNNKIYTSSKRYEQKHKEFRTSEKNVSHRQSTQVLTSRNNSEKSYSKPVKTQNSTVQKRHNSNRFKSENSVRKHSNSKVTNRQQSSGSRTHQSRAKQHN